MKAIKQFASDPERAEYLSDWFFNELRFPGSGDPDCVIAAIHESLRLISQMSSGDRDAAQEKLGEHLGCPSDGSSHWPYWMMLSVLDGCGLIDYGTSVGSCWLSDKGRLVLGLLDALGDDPDQWEEIAR